MFINVPNGWDGHEALGVQPVGQLRSTSGADGVHSGTGNPTFFRKWGVSRGVPVMCYPHTFIHTMELRTVTSVGGGFDADSG